MSRGDNIQEILGAIGSFWAKWGLRRVPQSQSFFVVQVNHATFWQFCNSRFLPNLVAKCTSVSRRGIRKDIFEKIFTLGVICPQNLKTKVGQTGTSLRAGYRSWDVLQRDTVYSTWWSFQDRLTFLYDIRLQSYGHQSCQILGFWPIFPIQNP